jgi:hypothetical protein
MEIKFRCDCGQALKVGEEAAGKTGKCPSCGKQVRIPTIEEAQVQPQPVQMASPAAQPSPAAGLKEMGKIGTCPYCNKKLESIPSRKKKCVFCGQYIYVRTRPEDRKRVLVTEKAKDEIELQWQHYYQAKEEKELMQDPDFALAKKELTKQFGKEPSLRDIKWRVYNERIPEYASKRQWGLYRNNKLDMAELLIEGGHHEQALLTLFEICYLDLNGCNNVGEGISTEDMERIGIHEFDMKMAFLAPVILSMVEDEITILKLENPDAKKLFVDRNNQTKPKKDMPLTPEEAWDKLFERMQERSRLRSIDLTDTKNIFSEIDELIGKKEYSGAAELLYKLNSAYYSKKKDYPDVKNIREHIPKLLNSEQRQISNAAESGVLPSVKTVFSHL